MKTDHSPPHDSVPWSHGDTPTGNTDAPQRSESVTLGRIVLLTLISTSTLLYCVSRYYATSEIATPPHQLNRGSSPALRVLGADDQASLTTTNSTLNTSAAESRSTVACNATLVANAVLSTGSGADDILSVCDFGKSELVFIDNSHVMWRVALAPADVGLPGHRSYNESSERSAADYGREHPDNSSLGHSRARLSQCATKACNTAPIPAWYWSANGIIGVTSAEPLQRASVVQGGGWVSGNAIMSPMYPTSGWAFYETRIGATRRTFVRCEVAWCNPVSVFIGADSGVFNTQIGAVDIIVNLGRNTPYAANIGIMLDSSSSRHGECVHCSSCRTTGADVDRLKSCSSCGYVKHECSQCVGATANSLVAYFGGTMKRDCRAPRVFVNSRYTAPGQCICIRRNLCDFYGLLCDRVTY